MRNRTLILSLWTLLVAGCGEVFDGTGGTTGTAGAGTGAAGGNTTSSSSGGGGSSVGGTGGQTSSSSTGGMATTSTSSGTTMPVGCGDGQVDPGDEECDDGNSENGDGCSATCKKDYTCGNGILEVINEQCDDGNFTPGDGCDSDCLMEPFGGDTCGDFSISAKEVCDDGNKINGDGCNPTCNLKGKTSLFAGEPGQGGVTDGVGGAARFSGTAVMTATATHLFLGEEASRRVRRVDLMTAKVETVAGNGNTGWVDASTGLDAEFGGIESIGTDGYTVWIGDAGNHLIRAMKATAPYSVTTAIGSGIAGHVDGIGANVQLNGVRGITHYNGYVYFLDSVQHTLRRFDPKLKEVVTLAGQSGMGGGTDGFGTNALYWSPRYMVSDGKGMLYISETNGNKIRAYNTVTTQTTTVAGNGTCGYVDGDFGAARVHRPRGITTDGTSLYWVEAEAHTIRQSIIGKKRLLPWQGCCLTRVLPIVPVPTLPWEDIWKELAARRFSSCRSVWPTTTQASHSM
ncbi:MAG: DUF4215 domain-containing protein [Polyangiaceae bacterium]|nr:DUF4215 domain-containing protein [Polyangiaceae bacterium]